MNDGEGEHGLKYNKGQAHKGLEERDDVIK